MDSCDLFDRSDEPSALHRLTPEQKDRLTDILDSYLSTLEKGELPPREELLKAHPDLAGPLETYLKGLDELHYAAAGWNRSSGQGEPATVEPGSGEMRLGDFQVVREIGRGGMGIVYEARQVSLGRRVALKVLPFAAILDPRQIARFRQEAQTAAQLDHPNIVSVFAVGVERGVHYYAMQCIDGQSLDRALAELGSKTHTGPGVQPEAITERPADAGTAQTAEFCRSQRPSFLTANSSNRQEYFRTVARLGIQAAEALQAAHEQGVVHRDVKPSNLLLDGEGKLWVTDFGLARCRRDASLTKTGDVVGTLRYMSPEQISGQSALVDHRTDVYSLGVTLYELLVLRPAFPGNDSPALLRQIEQQDPPRLRQLQPRIPADLETVVLKAMAKHPHERYRTAQELANDLRCFLEGKPTLAKPPTLSDRMGKWTRRHMRLVTTTAALCGVALFGTAASTLLISREKSKAEQNYVRAEQNFREAREAVDQFGSHLAERLADVPGAETVRRDLLRDTLRYYGNFVAQARDNPTLRADLALTYSKIGTLSGEIGSNDEAVAAHEKAIQLLQQLADDSPLRPAYRRQLAASQNNLALALRRAGRIDAACHAYQTAIRLQKELLENSPNAAECMSDLALSYANLGLLRSETSDAAGAETSFREAIRFQEYLRDLAPENPEYLRNLAAVWNNLSALYVGQQPERAAELHQQAAAAQAKAAALRPGELKYKGDLALTYNNLGAVQSRMGQPAEAAVSYRHAVEIQSELVRAAPAQNSYRHDLAVSCNNLGLTQCRLRQPAAAEQSFRKALDLQETLVRQNPHDLDLCSTLGGIYNNLGIVLEDLNRAAEAVQSYQQAVVEQQLALKQAPQVSRYREFLSKHYYNYGRVLRHLGRPEEAVRAALARRELWPHDVQHLLAVAEELAVATKLLAGSTDDGIIARQCAEYSMETLRQAMAAGWKPPRGFDSTRSFAILKDYPGFASLVHE